MLSPLRYKLNSHTTVALAAWSVCCVETVSSFLQGQQEPVLLREGGPKTQTFKEKN